MVLSVMGVILESTIEVNPAFQVFAETIQPFVSKVTLILGGVAGLYLIFVLSRIYFEQRKVKILEDIRYDLDQLNIYYGIRHSVHKKTVWRTISFKLKSLFDKK